MAVKAVILAAGEGVRMKSNVPKVLHKVMGQTMIEYVINAAKKAGAPEICVIVGHKGELVQETVNEECENIKFAWQKEQLGTGHAVLMSGDFISGDENVLVLCGDTPLVTSDTLSKLIEIHTAEENDVTVISALMENPSGYGRVIRDDSAGLKIVEHKDCDDSQLLVKEINTGVYIFKGNKLKEALSRLKNNNSQNEYYLTDTLELIKDSGGKAGVITAPDYNEFFGVNSRVQLSAVVSLMKRRINEYHMLNGVTIVDPDYTYIGQDIEIGMDTVIYPGTIIEGHTKIGSNCFIGPDSRIKSSIIHDSVNIQYSTILKSEIGSFTTVGPYAYLRPNSKIGRHCKVGDFVEVKNSSIGDGTKASHLTYIGDSEVGQNVNFGCGTVIVNYDGVRKYRTTIKDNVFVGCNSNLVSPVVLEENAYIAAGSTITSDVPENSLSIARAKQIVKIDWKKFKYGISLKTGETAKISLGTIPEPPDSPYALEFYSSNDEVAAVDATGKITANSCGIALITVTAADSSGAKKASKCRVTVSN